MKTRLRDPASWLLLAARASSRNLVFTFQLSTVQIFKSKVIRFLVPFIFPLWHLET